jgi:surface protein
MILDDEDILIGESISSSVFEPIVCLILCGEKLSEKDFEILSNGDNNYKVKDRKELDIIIDYFINSKLNTISLNWLDVSNITNMCRLFHNKPFKGDISKWNTSNVENMSYMFWQSAFNGDISNWDTGKVTDMKAMFYSSKFNQEIGNWDVSNVEDMSNMFKGSKFNKDISQWNVSNVVSMARMFENTNFNKDISQWNIKSLKSTNYMFCNSKFNKDISNWDVSSVVQMYGMFYNSKLNAKYIKNWVINIFLLQLHSFQKADMKIYDMGNSYYVSNYDDNDTYVEYNGSEYTTNGINKFNKLYYHSKVPTICLTNNEILRYVLEVDIDNISNKEILHQSACIDSMLGEIDSYGNNKYSGMFFDYILNQLAKNNPSVTQSLTLEPILKSYSAF